MSAPDTLGPALHALRDGRAERAAYATPALAAQIEALQRFQAERMRALHRKRAERHDGAALLNFLTETFYRQADWSELTNRPDKVAARIDRIISDQRPLVIAVRLQASADVMDAAVAEAMRGPGGATAPVNPSRYVRAFRTVGRRDERERQIEWMGQLVELLGGYADNRAAYWAFKLAGAPARALGMGATYGLLAEGFAAMRATADLECVTRAALAEQRALLDRLLPK